MSLILDGANGITAGGVTLSNTELSYLDGAASSIQTQLNTRVQKTGDETIAGIKTFSSFPLTPSSAPTTNYQIANKKYVDDAKILIASAAEVLAGTDNTKAVTPSTLKSVMPFTLVWTGSTTDVVAIPNCPVTGDCCYMVSGVGAYNSYNITHIIGRVGAYEFGSVQSYLQGLTLVGTSTAKASTYSTTIKAIWRIF